MNRYPLFVLLFALGHCPAFAADFFKIVSVKLLSGEPRDGVGVWEQRGSATEFQPCLEVKVTTGKDTRSDSLIAKAYFFDDQGKQIGIRTGPAESGKPADKRFAMPVIFPQSKPERLFFDIPKEIREKNWKALVVFGDKKEASAAMYPQTESHFLLEFPEKGLVAGRAGAGAERKAAVDPLVEHVVKTRNPQMPQITLFLRMPVGVSDPRELEGVMAICVLADSVEEIKHTLQMAEMPGDYRGLLGFANANKLAIVAWGSRQLWDQTKNYDELTGDQAKKIEQSFDLVADAWEQGVGELREQYGLPPSGFLLWGISGSAQWAMRLCLRKPEYFLAIHIHIASSFDQPTPAAAGVLWCLTTGEAESGYERSRRFLADCQKLGYPIVYKAIIGLGHEGHPDAAELGFEFFKFALTQKALRAGRDKIGPAASGEAAPWPEAFRHPPYYGDLAAQEIVPPSQKEMITEDSRIALPTEKIAKIWARWPR